jgi:hypothetical protein
MAEAMNDHWDQAYQNGYDTAVRQMYLAVIEQLWELSPAAMDQVTEGKP